MASRRPDRFLMALRGLRQAHGLLDCDLTVRMRANGDADLEFNDGEAHRYSRLAPEPVAGPAPEVTVAPPDPAPDPPVRPVALPAPEVEAPVSLPVAMPTAAPETGHATYLRLTREAHERAVAASRRR